MTALKMIHLSNKRINVLLICLMYVSFLTSYGAYYVSIAFVDLPSFYYAADITFEGNQSPYNYPLLTQTGASSDQTVFPFMYPPPSLLTLYPYSYLSYKAATIVTLIANHLLILFFIYLFLFRILRLRLQDSFIALAIAYIFLYHPISVTLNRGQVNFAVLVFICLTWICIKQDTHAAITALPLSLAILVKTYPAVLLLYLMTKRKYRIMAWVLGYLGLFSIAAYLLLPRNVWSDWMTNVVPTGGYGRVPLNLFSPAAPWNQSINGFTSRLFLNNEFSDALIPNSAAATTVPYAIAALVILVSFALHYMTSKIPDSEKIMDVELSFVLLTMFLVAPTSWEHHLVFVLPSAIIALNLVLKSRNGHWPWALVIFPIFILAWRVPLWADILKQGILTLGISTKFYAVFFVWVFFASFIWMYVKNFNRTQRPAL